jgi:hypothetical protein
MPDVIRCLSHTGEWRGMPVAVKTLVFHWNGTNPAERPWPHVGLQSQKKFEPQPIIEAAIAASVGHPNLVRIALGY